MAVLDQVAFDGDTLAAALRAILQRRADLSVPECGWSWAELRPDASDYRWLQEWANRLEADTVNDWVCPRPLPHGGRLMPKRQQPHYPHVEVGGRQMDRRVAVGALLTFLYAEVARRDATEDELWSCVRGILPAEVQDVLFDDDNPRECQRTALRMAAREPTLGYRHVFGDPDRQEWVTTIRLQFGFTRLGLEKRLPAWIAGARPEPVALLLDGHGGREPWNCSLSFRETWDAIREWYQCGGSASEETQKVLETSPWLPATWDELSRAIQRPARVQSGVRPSTQHAAFPAPSREPDEDLSSRLVSAVRFEWPSGGQAAFVLEFGDLSAYSVEGNPSDCVLQLDGRQVGRLYRQGGGYTLELDRAPVRMPFANCREATALLQPAREDGEPLGSPEVVDLWDASAPFVLYELRTGRVVDADRELSCESDYGLLLSGDVTVAPRQAETASSVSGWRAVWIRGREAAALELTCDGRDLWCPRGVGRRPLPSWTEAVEPRQERRAQVGQEVAIVVSHPPGVILEAARCRGVRLGIQPVETDLTRLIVAVPAGPRASTLSVNLWVMRKGENWPLRRALELDLVGISRRGTEGWVACPPAQEIDLGEVAQSLHFIHAPTNSAWRLEIAQTQLGSGINRCVRLPSDLSAYGAPLELVEDWDGGQRITLAGAVVDRGCVGSAVATDEGQWRLCLRKPIEPSSHHAVVWWGRSGELVELAPSVAEDPRVWSVIPDVQQQPPRALVVQFKGECLGTWWAPDWFRDLPASTKPAADLVRWTEWRLPLLATEAREALIEWLLDRMTDLLADTSGLDAASKAQPAAALCAETLRRWVPPIGCARALLFNQADRVVSASRLEPGFAARVLEAAFDHQHPFKEAHWEHVGRLAGMLADLPREQWPRGRQGILILLLAMKVEHPALRRLAEVAGRL